MDIPGLYRFIDTLTRQHDQLRMVRCFLDLLAKEFGAQDVFYYEVHARDLNNHDQHEGPKLYNPLSNKNTILEFDEHLRSVFKSREMFIGDISETDHRRCI